MTGFVPAIHVPAAEQKGVDARHKDGHDAAGGKSTKQPSDLIR
jgi:hypothetical protein